MKQNVLSDVWMEGVTDLAQDGGYQPSRGEILDVAGELSKPDLGNKELAEFILNLLAEIKALNVRADELAENGDNQLLRAEKAERELATLKVEVSDLQQEVADLRKAEVKEWGKRVDAEEKLTETERALSRANRLIDQLATALEGFAQTTR